MMKILWKSTLKDILLLWTISNLKFCVTGHPMSNALCAAEDAKILGATAHGDDVLQVSSDFSHQTPDGRNIGTTAVVKRPKTGLEDSEVAGAMGNGHLNSLDALREQPKNDLSGADVRLLASQVDDSKSTPPVHEGTKSSEQPPKSKDVSAEPLDKKGSPSTGGSGGEDGKILQSLKSGAERLEIWARVKQDYEKLNMENNPLKYPQRTTNLEAPGAPDLPPIFAKGLGKAFRIDFKYLKPAEVQKLPPYELLRYISERDVNVRKNTRKLDDLARNYYSAQKDAFYAAAGESADRIDLDIENLVKKRNEVLVSKGKFSQEYFTTFSQNIRNSLEKDFIKKAGASDLGTEFRTRYTKLQTAKSTYDQAFNLAYEDAQKLISSESLAPGALAKLTDAEYVRKAAFFDETVAQNLDDWMFYEKQAAQKFNELYPKVLERFKKIKGEEKFNGRMRSIIKKLDPHATAESTDPEVIKQAERQFVKEAKALKDPEIKKAAFAIKSWEKTTRNAKNNAIRSADKIFKRNKILESADLRYPGWSFKRFMQKILDWFFGRERKGHQNKEATTTAKPSAVDGPTQKTVPESTPKTKPAYQSEQNLVKPGKHTPEVPKQPEVEATSVKGVDTSGNADLRAEPPSGVRGPGWSDQASSGETPSLSQGSWTSWLPRLRKKVQNTAFTNRWWSRYRSDTVSSESETTPLLGPNHIPS
ncbi:uncharacterized protein MELLADRAFT_124208 [Melampsora larici-populina 98AG31]|uniref:Secreted protein n=1 Tax=Melampsora larici-populina (strain 98AG31 / pathotype 3-4-7) TaxID=747676 RepID=F4S8Q3_MELLP|nr:uncharacterized protein MELLADRAFT_124208 [Melampsora larici-populina 98AG31]EGF98984.1 secreted protein [Melampsora larici-populina 98AG31]